MTANVAIRFSVENAETVRKALESLGKDGEKALSALNAGSASPGRGLNALSSVMDQLRSQAMGFAFSLGPVGTGLVALGPAGLAAAAAIGGVASVISNAAERANGFVDNLRRMNETAEALGLTAQELQALQGAAGRFGIDGDEATRFIDRLATSVEELRRGGGRLFDELLRVDRGLMRQVASTQTTREAVDLLGRAYANLDTNAQRALEQAIGGRNATGRGRMLEEFVNRGGFAEVDRQAREAGTATTEFHQRLIDTRREIEEIKKKTDGIYNKMFTPEVLEYQRRSAQHWLSVAESAERFVAALRLRGEDPSQMEPGVNTLGPRRQGPQRPTPGMSGDEIVDSINRQLADQPQPQYPNAVALAEMRRWTALMGDALKPSEQLTLRTLELMAAMERGDLTLAHYNRSLAAFKDQQDRAAVSVRQQLAIATEEEMLQRRLADLRDQYDKRFIRNLTELAAAERIVRREVRETAEQLRVRNSEFPAFERLAIDANNLQKALDDGLAGALRGSTQTMLEMAKGTTTLGKGFADLSSRILDAVTSALLMKSIVGPMSTGIQSALGNMFSGGPQYIGPSGIGAGGSTTVTPSAFGNAFGRGNIIPFARGGVVTRPTLFPMANGMGLMGEAGEEAVMPLRRLNNGRLGVSAEGTGVTLNVTHQVINNHPSAKVSQRDEDDGRGGRRTVTVIDELMAAAASRPGSQTALALRGAGSLTRR